MGKKATGRAAKGGRLSAIEKLEPAEAQAVLSALLKEHPQLRERAEEIARSLMGDISFEGVAADVEWALTSLDLDDLDGRAGRHDSGYVSPTEAAWELLQEAIEPMIQDMERRRDLGLASGALEMSKGLLLGLYTVRKYRGEGCLSWAEDFTAQTADGVLEKWCGAGKKGKHARRFPRSFVAKHLPEWADRFDGSLLR